MCSAIIFLPEESYFPVDRTAVIKYNALVNRNILAMKKALRRMLFASPEDANTSVSI
jgi:hypothetical protein